MSNNGREQVTTTRVFVGGISWKADETSLANFFSAYGTVIECKIIMDKVTGKSKGYGFVTFQDAESANNVKQSTNLYFLGKMMNVGDAVRKSDSAGGQPTNLQGGAGRLVQIQPHQIPYQLPYGFNPYYANGAYYAQQQPYYGNMTPQFVPVGYTQAYNPMYAPIMDPQATPFQQQGGGSQEGWQPIPTYQQQTNTTPSQQQQGSSIAHATFSPTPMSPNHVPQAYQPTMQPNVQQPSK